MILAGRVFRKPAMQSAQNGGLGVWESQVRIAVAHLISTENWESRSASVTMFSHSEMEMLSTYTHHCREAKLWENTWEYKHLNILEPSVFSDPSNGFLKT